MKKPGWQANEALVKSCSAKRSDVNYEESKVGSYELPDVLSDGHGGRVKTAAEWRVRRAELLDLFRREMFGYSPERPADMWFEEIHRDTAALNGEATLKLVDIHLGASAAAPVIHLELFIPNRRTAPASAFLLICNRDKTNIDWTREIKSEFWPVEQVIARGYACAAFFNGDVAIDKYDGFTTGIHAYLQAPETRTDTSWGTLAAWAWGGSRVMDYFETDPDIDEKHCAVTGHSRGGKTALWCGAQDERWALTISSCSGCGGAALSRRNFGETLEVIQNVFKHWFCGNYRKYIHHENELPFDEHCLVALMAPRAVYIHSADEDLWADQRGEWLSLLNAEPVWKLLGRKGLPVHDMPALDEPVMGDGMAYHIRPGEHNNKLCDWMRHLDLADREFGRN